MAAGSQSFSIPLVTEMQIALYRKAGLTRSGKLWRCSCLAQLVFYVVLLFFAEVKKYMN